MSGGPLRALWAFLWIGLTSLGAGRQAYLHRTFVDGGWIPEQVFLSDYAKSTVLPGASFVNLTFLCGLRIGGFPTAIIGTILVFLPGTVAIVAATIVLSAPDPRVDGLLHGILVGAVAVFALMLIRLRSAAMTSSSARLLALTAFAMTIAAVPLVVIVVVIGGVGLYWYRPRRDAAP
jgi:chromate transporter